MKREPGAPAMSPYGDYDTMLRTLVDQLTKAPYLLGERMSAADVLWGTALTWTTMFKLVPELPAIKEYIGRIGSRPAAAKVKALDAALAAEHEAAMKQAAAS
jgi:glutathione S-transferase